MKYAKLCAIKNKSVRDIVKYDLQNPMWVTEALNRPQKCPNIVLNGKFSQPHSQYPVQAQASDGAVFPLYLSLSHRLYD